MADLESYVQACRRAAQAVADAPGSSTAELITSLEKAFPHLKEHIEGYFHFASSLGGLTSPHLDWFFQVHQRFCPMDRSLKGSLLKAVSELSPAAPKFKRAVPFAANKCPTKFVASGICQWISAADVKAVDRTKAEAAEAVLDRGDALLRHVYLESPEGESETDIDKTKKYMLYQKKMVQFEANVVRFVLNKKNEKFTEYESLDQIEAELAEKCVKPDSTPEKTAAAKTDGILECNFIV